MLRLLFLLTMFLASPALADPPIPEPLAAHKARGAQIYYLGKYETLDSWVMIRTGQPEFYYVTPDGRAIVMGLLFSGTGDPITMSQLKALDLSKEGGIVDMMKSKLEPAPTLPAPDDPVAAAPAPSPAPAPVPVTSAPGTEVANKLVPSTPGNKLFADVQNASGLLMGNPGVPVFHAFIDPNCHHCQYFLQHIEPYVTSGQLAVRIIPVGFEDKSRRQAAFMLSAADGAALLMRYIKGDKDALPAPESINVAGVEANTAIMTDWSLLMTPVIVYTAGKDGSVKLIRGRPLDFDGAVADLTGKP